MTATGTAVSIIVLADVAAGINPLKREAAFREPMRVHGRPRSKQC
jgi:hypothetical protein